MTRLSKWVSFATCLVSFLTFSNRADAAKVNAVSLSGLNSFYSSIATSVETAKGTANIYFTAGTWKTSVRPIGFALSNVELTIPAGERATFQFDYQDGVLQQGASVTFSPEIEVTSKGHTVVIEEVDYDEFGHATVHYKGNSESTAIEDSSYYEEAFSLDRNAGSLLTAKFFKNLNRTEACQQPNGTDCQAPTPTIAEIDFEKLDAHHPGLLVSFRDGSVITFNASNRISFDGPASANFSELTYDATHQAPLVGHLDNLTANLGPSQITTNGLTLNIQSGISLNVGSIDFGADQNDPNNYIISMTNTSGDLSLGDSTSVTLDGGTQFLVNAGSQLHAVNWAVQFPQGAGNPSVTVGAGSTFSLDISNGVFHPTPNSVADVAAGHVDVLLNGGDWNGRTPDPGADLTLSNLSVVLSSGTFALNDSSLIAIGDGSTIEAPQLVWLAAKPGFDGALKTLNVRLDVASMFDLPSGFQLDLNSNSNISMLSDHPIILHAGMYPSGGIKLDGNFSIFRDQSQPTFGMTDGLIHLTALLNQDGSYSVQQTTIDGLLTLNNGAMSMLWNVHMHDVSGTRNVGGLFNGAGYFSATIQPGWSFPITTPAIYHTPGHDDMRIYPIDLTISTIGPTTVPDTAVTFGPSFSLASQSDPTQVSLPIVVGILPGRGEHQQPDDQESSADGTHGPDQDQHRQEVFTDTFPGCRVHFYIIPGNYNLNARLSFSIYPQNGVNDLSAKIDNVALQQDIGLDRDGCSAENALTGILGVAGLLVGGPFDGAVGGAIGHFGGGRIDDVIDSRVEAGLRDYINSRGASWTIALP